MTSLKIFHAHDADHPLWESNDFTIIQQKFKDLGVRFERWKTDHKLSATPSQKEVIDAYQHEIDQLVSEEGYQSWDVISIRPDAPEKEVLREKFLQEHTHSDDEVRFFVEGVGLFSINLGEHVAQVVCEKNDLIAVPAGTLHWFDMGATPSFTAIRLFNHPDGWAANFTGNRIVDHFPKLN